MLDRLMISVTTSVFLVRGRSGKDDTYNVYSPRVEGLPVRTLLPVAMHDVDASMRRFFQLDQKAAAMPSTQSKSNQLSSVSQI